MATIILQSSTVSSGTTVVSADQETLSNTFTGSAGLLISSGGISVQDTVQSGGTVTVLAGGSATGLTVSSGGSEILSSGGTDIGVSIGSAGNQSVLSGGVASGTTVSSGRRRYGLRNAVGITVSSGGVEHVLSGAVLNGATINGGLVEISSGGTAGTLGFSSAGGTLQLDDSVHFGGIISGFGVPGGIDLRDIAFGSGTTLGFTESGDNLSGTLTVSNGTNTANITLLGQYVAANFTKQADGHGGTLITDPPVQSLTGGVFIPHS